VTLLHISKFGQANLESPHPVIHLSRQVRPTFCIMA
jgi:hypothetical protein